MAGYVEEYKIQNYQKIKPLNLKDNLWIVMDSVTQKQFVMRKLSMDSQNVYLILSGLRHPNIIEVTDLFSYDGFLYIIEEYLEWELLSEVIPGKRFSRHDAFFIGRQLLDALSVLHQHKIIHRDIKPDNIMIDKKGNVKLIDFDIARLFSEDKQKDTSLKGSYTYAPPEQFGFSQTDRRTDIYSLGITLNELITGTFPEIRLCSGRLGIFIRRCIELDPRKRYQTAEQALKSLRRLQKAPLFLAAGVVLLSLTMITVLFPLSSSHKALTNTTLPSESSNLTDDNHFSSQEPDQTNEIPYSFGGYADEDIDYSYLDSIIYVKDRSRYPSILMAEDQSYEFTADLNIESFITASAVKKKNYLELTCTFENGSSTRFEFHDVFLDTYKQNVETYINTDIENTSPEFEILFDDIDRDGKTELLITFAWLQRIDTLDPAFRYFLIEYSSVWVVYLDAQNQLCCSKPLYFEGCHPSLETDDLLYNDNEEAGYIFHNKTWEIAY